jgi:hypothetical protein
VREVRERNYRHTTWTSRPKPTAAQLRHPAGWLCGAVPHKNWTKSRGPVRGKLNSVVGTAKEVPGTVKTAFSSPKNFGLFVGSAASYSLGVGILWRATPLAWRSCMGTPTTLLDTLGKIKHPVSCMFLVKYVATPGVGFLGMGGLMSRELADEELGRSTK